MKVVTPMPTAPVDVRAPLNQGSRPPEQLGTVFVELSTMTIRNVLSFPDFWTVFDDDGAPVDPAPLTAAADAFFGQLLWWARALREARVRNTP